MEITRNSAAAAEDKSQLLGFLQIKIDGNEEKIKALKPFKEEEEELPTIYRVPDAFHKMNEGAYSPSVVAIGPLHRGKKHLQAMEGVKLSYMLHLFHRTGTFKQTQDDCVAAMLKKESRARRCYADDVRVLLHHEDDKPAAAKLENSKTSRDGNSSFADHQNVRFAEMMLIDGCFMIELFYRNYLEETDAIVANAFKHTAVEHDLLLLENQLPSLVLETLFSLTVKRISGNCDLTECVLSFFGNVLSLKSGKLIKKDNMPTAHILHLLHSCYLPAPEEAEKPGSPEEETEKLEVLKSFKYSATELDLGGIKFRQGNKEDIFDFKFTSSYHCHFFFSRRGEFKIPALMVNDYTELFLRNFIAFEQSCTLLVNPYFSSHAFIMDRLINTAEDVKLLEKAEIICNIMGSREEVASLFNNLCKNITIDRLYSTEECLEVIQFHKHRWPKFLVKLRRDYFSNPWTLISVFAASILFVLTLLQTIYTMRS